MTGIEKVPDQGYHILKLTAEREETYYVFVGRNLSGANIQVVTNQATAIDSGYDNTVELYHTLYIAPIAGDSGSTNGPIYTYQYAVD